MKFHESYATTVVGMVEGEEFKTRGARYKTHRHADLKPLPIRTTGQGGQTLTLTRGFIHHSDTGSWFIGYISPISVHSLPLALQIMTHNTPGTLFTLSLTPLLICCTEHDYYHYVCAFIMPVTGLICSHGAPRKPRLFV
jgi:hypothetical protein